MYRSHDSFWLKKTIWLFYLAVALMFLQGAQLHLHVYDHDPDQAGHGHHEQVHFDYDADQIGHHDVMAEIDLSPQGLLKSFSIESLVIALFAAVIVFFLPHLLTRSARYLNYHVPVSSWPFSLRPPLRAPPL